MNAPRPPKDREESPLPPRATGIFLGLWMAVMIFLALVVVPQAFAVCTPPPS